MGRYIASATGASLCWLSCAVSSDALEPRTIRFDVRGRWLAHEETGRIVIEEYEPALKDHADFLHASDHWATRGDGFRFFLERGDDRLVMFDLLSAYGMLDAGVIDIEGDGVDEFWYICAEGRGIGPANRRWLTIARVEPDGLFEFFSLQLAGWYLGRTISDENPPFDRWERVYRFVDLDGDGDVEVDATLNSTIAEGVVLTRAEDLQIELAKRVIYTLRPDREGMMIDDSGPRP